MMTVFVGDILNATAAPVVAYAGSTRTLQWLRNGSAIPSATATAYRVTDAEIANAISVLQLETNFMGSASATSAPTATVQAWSPSTLFALSEPGVWFDPSDLSTLYQDAAGATPVTAPAQPVGLVLDKSQGLVLGPELVTNGTFDTNVTGWTQNTAGTLSWDNGRAKVVANGSTQTSAYQTITVVAGRTYRISGDLTVDVLAGGSVNLSLRDGASATSNTLQLVAQSTATGSVSGTVLYTATSSSLFIHARTTNHANTYTFDNISVRELPGFHATQSTAASRPTYGIVPSRGRVNLITSTEEFLLNNWSRTNTTVAANAGTSPIGGMTAAKLIATATTGEHGINQNMTVVASTTYTYSCFMKAAEETVGVLWQNVNGGTLFDLVNGTVVSGVAGAAIVAVGGGWYRCSVPYTPTGTVGLVRIRPRQDSSYTGDGTSGILIWGAQLELGSTATPYQRVVSQFDVTDPVGFPSYPLHYLFFGGDLDPRWLQTSTITPSADKVQVFAGVRKLSDAAVALVAETSPSLPANNGAFYLAAPVNNGTGNYGWGSKGTSASAPSSPASYPAPITNVLVGIGDIAGDSSLLRVNGAQVAQSALDQGTGNYLAYPLYIGRRGGTSLAFNGQLYGLIVRFGANLSTSVINRAEYFVSQKTGVTL